MEAFGVAGMYVFDLDVRRHMHLLGSDCVLLDRPSLEDGHTCELLPRTRRASSFLVAWAAIYLSAGNLHDAWASASSFAR